MLSKIGTILNDITGATSAGKQSQKYAMDSAILNNKYQKEFAQNAHQWEVEDLKKAGLNPVLSAGGGGASASGGGVNSASVASAGEDPISLGIGAWNGVQSALKSSKEQELLEAQAKNTDADTQLKKLQGINQMSQSNLTQHQRYLLNAQVKEIMETLPLTKQEKKQNIKESEQGTTGKIFGTEIGEESISGMKKYAENLGDYAWEYNPWRLGKKAGEKFYHYTHRRKNVR